MQKETKRGPSFVFDCVGSDYKWKGQKEVDAGYVVWFHQVLTYCVETPISILSYSSSETLQLWSIISLLSFKIWLKFMELY